MARQRTENKVAVLWACPRRKPRPFVATGAGPVGLGRITRGARAHAVFVHVPLQTNPRIAHASWPPTGVSLSWVPLTDQV
jgi:hypothetical protein